MASPLQVLVLNNIAVRVSSACPRRAISSASRSSGRTRSSCAPRHARDGHPAKRAGDRPRRLGDEQHPGGGDVEARRAGFNAPGANANAVKELVLAALLLAARNVVPALALRVAAESGAGDLDRQVEDGKKAFAGVELPRRTLGILGLGAIGSLVADTAIKLGMNVVGFDPEITVDAAWRLPSSVHKAHSVEELLKRADFVTLHVPLLPVTRHMIDAARLAAMKPGSVLLNFARDALVDDEAVKAALRRGHLKYYSAIFRRRRSSPSPASSRCRISARRRRRRRSTRRDGRRRGAAFLENGTIANAVNFPNVDMVRSRRTASPSPTRTSPTCWARSRSRWGTAASTSTTW
jgi:hypothetical protein